jgi:hypothetical protein
MEGKKKTIKRQNLNIPEKFFQQMYAANKKNSFNKKRTSGEKIDFIYFVFP